MSLFPDRGADQRKEEVLQRAPFLKTYLNSTYQKLNYESWARDLKNEGDPLLEEMSSRLGNNWYRLTIMPLLISAETSDIFHPEMPKDLKFSIIRGMVMAGFEIGNLKDVDIVLIDVVKDLGEDGNFHPQCLAGEAGATKAVDFVSTLLKTGAYLREVPPIDNSGIRPNQPINPFDNFINGLDFKGL
jgi:hypothetical protein